MRPLHACGKSVWWCVIWKVKSLERLLSGLCVTSHPESVCVCMCVWESLLCQQDGDLKITHTYGWILSPCLCVSTSLSAANSVVRNKRPQMMRPTGVHTTYHALRGQTLELECIVQGLWVSVCVYVCVSAPINRKSWATSYNQSYLPLTHSPLLRHPHITFIILPSCLLLYATMCFSSSPLHSLLCHTFPSSFFPLLLRTTLFLLLHHFSPTPDVSWLRKDGELSESRTTIEMFGRRLRFSSISESDTGEYQCRANNTQGKITHTYTVMVDGMSHTHTLFFPLLFQVIYVLTVMNLPEFKSQYRQSSITGWWSVLCFWDCHKNVSCPLQLLLIGSKSRSVSYMPQVRLSD